MVICAGGGGIPTMACRADRFLTGIEAVIDKDLASELLARELAADLFVMATDVDAVYDGWGTPEQRGSPTSRRRSCARDPCSRVMGPKVAAAAQFVEHTGRRAAIGSLADIEQIVAGTAGTNVVAGHRGPPRSRITVEESGSAKSVSTLRSASSGRSWSTGRT